MKQVKLSEALGYRINAWSFISSVNPYTKMVSVDSGTGASLVAWDHLKESFGIEIVPTPEELVMVERGRLSLQVEEKARDLRSVIENWLFSEKAR